MGRTTMFFTDMVMTLRDASASGHDVGVHPACVRNGPRRHSREAVQLLGGSDPWGCGAR